ncbi:hypothetical protein [uncultured Ruegeria sp.]|uniref:hypothetical protein n=1 Tax=uncultured Ruegeria sp. TaxID=259304 RepID=UPI002620CD05|nr:hypothetical protein [uncultured Ruegeria sp.]
MNADITNAFEAHAIDNTTFGHVEHVQVAYDLLRKYDFIDAATIYAKGIRTLAAKAGAPDKFNLTITYAFMSLIAERLAYTQTDDFERFTQGNPDLMANTVLDQWYTKERLNSALARGVFLLPAAA